MRPASDVPQICIVYAYSGQLSLAEAPSLRGSARAADGPQSSMHNSAGRLIILPKLRACVVLVDLPMFLRHVVYAYSAGRLINLAEAPSLCGSGRSPDVPKICIV